MRLARQADVVYATATYAAAAVAAARRPLVVKLVSDPAYERARRYGLVSGSLEEFQHAAGAGVTTLKYLRTAALRRARRIVVPSRYLAEIAAGWGIDAGVIDVLTNPAPPPQTVDPELLDDLTLVFVGRLTEQKGLPVLLEAMRRVPAAKLVLVGDGPERQHLNELASQLGVADRITFTGSLPREHVLRYLSGAEAAVLPSLWENLPHSAVEALAVGTPVVATAVGGVPEVVRDGENGLLVPPNDPEALAAALTAILGDHALRARLAAGTKPSVAAIGRDVVYEQLEAVLTRAGR